MGMLIDVLDKRIRELKDLRQREERRDNQSAQNALDQKYKVLAGQIHELMLALKYTKENMSFQLSEAVLDDVNTMLLDQKATVQSGYADKEMVFKVESELKSILISIKKEWAKEYLNLTSATVSTLKVIVGVDTEKVSDCLGGIAKGETWTTDINEFQTMNKSMADANTLISGLGLDEQIISFLQKMNSGKATIADLDDKVMNWLRTEELDKRVKLSFSLGMRKN